MVYFVIFSDFIDPDDIEEFVFNNFLTRVAWLLTTPPPSLLHGVM